MVLFLGSFPAQIKVQKLAYLFLGCSDLEQRGARKLSKPKGSSVLPFHSPDHIASALMVFISGPECCLKSFNTLKRVLMESRST